MDAPTLAPTCASLRTRLMRRLHGPVYARRVRVLADAIVPWLRPGDRVLDVGCGGGGLGQAVLAHPERPTDLRWEGLEPRPRGGEPIPVTAYGGGSFPFGDRTFDVVVIADVLHHEADEEGLLAECVRVSRRLVIVKDHQRQGLLAQQRISLIDWAANDPYGVPCLYRYHRPQEWLDLLHRHGLQVEANVRNLRLYPPPYAWCFGPRIQFFAVGSVRRPPATPTGNV